MDQELLASKAPAHGISKIFIALTALVILGTRSVAATARDPQTAKPVHAVITAGVGGAWVNEYVNLVTPAITLIATVLAILWYSVTIYESKTVQDWRARKPERIAAKVARKAAKEKERWKRT
jgi:hypothetical protein